jgi:hypothetical protein
MARFKCEVFRCSEEKRNYKIVVIFGVDKSKVLLWWKHKTAIRESEASRKIFTGPRKDDFLKLMT